MLSKINGYFEDQEIGLAQNKFLLAISGGMDSMAMLHAFVSLKANISVAHINHGLRPEEGTEESALVKQFCQDRGIPFYSKELDSTAFENKNLQNTAREFRYIFFNKICSQEDLDYICTAHHIGDSIETFLLNFAKGSGLKGLSGIPSRIDNVLRPLANVYPSEIENYVKSHKIPFLEDSSNQDTKYARNFIRHQIVNNLKTVAPNLSKTAFESIANIKDSNELLLMLTEEWKKNNCRETKDKLSIPIEAIHKMKGQMSLLFILLQKFGFNRNQIETILTKLDKTGLCFEGRTATLWIERKDLVVVSKEYEYIQPESLKIKVDKVGALNIATNPFVEFIDGTKINLPLILRKPHEGEKMQPLGMNGQSKKISDIAIDKKLSKLEKENLLMVYHGDTPVWLWGLQLDHRFKVDEQSKVIYKISIEENSLDIS